MRFSHCFDSFQTDCCITNLNKEPGIVCFWSPYSHISGISLVLEYSVRSLTEYLNGESSICAALMTGYTDTRDVEMGLKT